MTREEQIKKFNPYRDWGHTRDNCEGCKEAHYHEGFNLGAKWADEHPNWYKISDNVYNLPDEMGGRYNVVLKNRPNETLYGIFYGDYWDIGGQSYLFHEVAFWAELPQPPKFD